MPPFLHTVRYVLFCFNEFGDFIMFINMWPLKRSCSRSPMSGLKVTRRGQHLSCHPLSMGQKSLKVLFQLSIPEWHTVIIPFDQNLQLRGCRSCFCLTRWSACGTYKRQIMHHCKANFRYTSFGLRTMTDSSLKISHKQNSVDLWIKYDLGS